MKVHQEGTQKMFTHQNVEGVTSVGVGMEGNYIFLCILVYYVNFLQEHIHTLLGQFLKWH